MPQHLLSLLSDQPRSAAWLAGHLGLEAGQIAELVAGLQAEGVPVLTTEGGYALPAGTPAPALVIRHGEFGRALRYLGRTDSTQNEVRRWADDPCHPAPHGAVVVAEYQTAARGRRGRVWQSPVRNLPLSLLLLRGPDGAPLQPADLSLMPLAAGVALREAAGVGALKWPNDLLTPDRRKLAGILLEAELRGQSVRRAVLGIGINVAQAPAGAACLHEVRPELTRATLLGDLLAALEHWLTQPAPAVLDAWRSGNLTLGHQVEVQTLHGPLAGRASDLDETGGLIVETPDGQRHTISAGDVQLVGRLAEAAAAPLSSAHDPAS